MNRLPSKQYKAGRKRGRDDDGEFFASIKVWPLVSYSYDRLTNVFLVKLQMKTEKTVNRKQDPKQLTSKPEKPTGSPNYSMYYLSYYSHHFLDQNEDDSFQSLIQVVFNNPLT